MTTGSPAPRRTRMLGLALLVATFLAGGFSGAAIDRMLVAGTPPAPAREKDRDPERREDRDRRRESDLFDRLDLTGEQRARIDSILDHRKTQMEAFWDEAGPRLRMIVDSTRAEIRATLSPAQQEEYDRLRAKRRGADRAHRNRGDQPEEKGSR